MRYISVRRLVVSLGLNNAYLNKDLIAEINRKLSKHFDNEDTLSVFEQKYRYYEFRSFFDLLEKEEYQIYYNEIENNNSLVSYLLNSGEFQSMPEISVVHSIEVENAEKFQSFVSIFLKPILIEKIQFNLKNSSTVELSYHLKFCDFIPYKSRIAIQKPIANYLNQIIGQLKVSQGVSLRFQILKVFDNDIACVLNEMDDYFSSLRQQFVQTAKLLFNKNELSKVELEMIKSTIMKVKLDKESSIRRDVFIRAKKIKEPPMKTTSNFDSMVKSPLFLITSIVVILNLIFYYEIKSDEMKSTSEENLIENETLVPKFPFLIDTVKTCDSLRILVGLSKSDSKVLYIGEEKDSLMLDYDLSDKYFSYENPVVQEVPLPNDESDFLIKMTSSNLQNIDSNLYSDYFKDPYLGRHIPNWNNAKIELSVDTTQIVSNYREATFSTEKACYRAFPVRLKNISDSTIVIGYGAQIPLVLQRKDSTNSWVICDHPFTYACGMGLSSIFLPKNEIVISSVAILSEDLPSLYRLKIGENFSPPFNFDNK
ncbi:hypothetical protein [Brumimicrobium aurantiacum]|uniref:Uncharacterized protein n=1 Tax=Brumimicrobium aurantiacum TaxID=1737063 RepID=A0A3E1F1T9_9FLAO|nr:hypothetical protein [Brumimicrobium aurantiacum]RFC55788.1 hypothetical protein DXU93_02300 [Brumimicrobium aurantiacum]